MLNMWNVTWQSHMIVLNFVLLKLNVLKSSVLIATIEGHNKDDNFVEETLGVFFKKNKIKILTFNGIWRYE